MRKFSLVFAVIAVAGGCAETSGVWIPHTIKSIGAKAFTNCDNLSTLTLGYDGTTVSSPK